MKRLLLALSVLPLAGCFPTQISGSQVPTEHTFRLTDYDVEVAIAWSDECAQSWVTGDADADLAMAKKLLKVHGVRIKAGNPLAAGTALRRTLLVKKEMLSAPAEDQVRLFSHELVHYCQRDLIGNGPFDSLVGHSAGRWRVEVPAYLQTYRTMRVYGANDAKIERAIDRRLDSMRDSYWLHDIDPGQYRAKTRAIWMRALVDAA